MSTDSTERGLETLVDELARVVREPGEANRLLNAAGFPPQDTPVSGTWRTFWGRVIQDAANGKVLGRDDAVACAAAKQYPDNHVFRRWCTGGGSAWSGRLVEPKVGPTRLIHNATELFGRDEELRQLDAEWAGVGVGKANVAVIVGWGGVGKTSLVFEWMNHLAQQKYRGATAVFDWSFYSQGVKERGVASGDAFVREALRFFGDEAIADATMSAWDKGARLANLVGQQRALLVLDGLEPLQHPPGRGIAAGKLTDPAIAALLRGLARTNAGLCVVTTRERVEDLEGFRAVSQRRIDRLSKEAGVALLRFLLGCTQERDLELEEVCEALKGHALTLSLLGRFLHRRRWDVSRWREIRFEEADQKLQGAHAFHMLDAYERWLGGGNGETMASGRRMLAVLRLLGLFDGPADPGCIGALCEAPAIEKLTEPLVGLDEGEWSDILADLESLGLVNREPWAPLQIKGFPKDRTDLETGGTTGEPEVFPTPTWSRLGESLDAHPLMREHFGRRVRQTSEGAWREGHRRVFEHLCNSAPYWPEGVEGLRPLYQAVAHGCQAGEAEWACEEVYYRRINRGGSTSGYYSRRLGAFSTDLGAVSWFFTHPWTRLAGEISHESWVFGMTATNLRALGRLIEAIEATQAALFIDKQNPHNTMRHACTLSELKLLRGQVTAAVGLGETWIGPGKHSSGEPLLLEMRSSYASALHLAGRYADARKHFEQIEAMQADAPRNYPLRGIQYCDLLLSDAERIAWQATIAIGGNSAAEPLSNTVIRALAMCNEVLGRVKQAPIESSTHNDWPLDTALNHLLIGRVLLYQTVLTTFHSRAQGRQSGSHDLIEAQRHIGLAVDDLRCSRDMTSLPRGLLTRAWLRWVLRDSGVQSDLDEVEALATRCGMPIFLADVYLTRARLFGDHAALGEACTLLANLSDQGYHRHDDMLADTRAAAERWPTQ
jgi:hypothetical protein